MSSYAPAPAPAPLPYGLIGSSNNVDYVDNDIIDDLDFHLKCFKSDEATDDDDDLMSLCSVPEQLMSPLHSQYNHNGLHVCLFCGRSFNYIETHIGTYKKGSFGSFKDYGDMIDKLKEKIDKFFKTKDRIVALKVLIEEKKSLFKENEKEKYLAILQNLVPI